jgi:hypothetical protein
MEFPRLTTSSCLRRTRSRRRAAAPIDITAFQLDEGQAVAQQRQIVAALFHQLQQAYLPATPPSSSRAVT